MSALVTDVAPPAAVILISTTPEPGGATDRSEPSLSTVNHVDATPPKVTEVTPKKLAPSIPTTVPPAVEPLVGRIPLIFGAGGLPVKVKLTFDVVGRLIWLNTRTPSTPDPGGVTAVILLSLTILNDFALSSPKMTLVAPVKPDPVSVTDVPPLAEPDAGEIWVTTAGAMKVTWSLALAALVPNGVVTVTSTVPGCSAGVTAVICESLTTVKLVAARAPNLTAVAPVNPVPSMVSC